MKNLQKFILSKRKTLMCKMTEKGGVIDLCLDKKCESSLLSTGEALSLHMHQNKSLFEDKESN